MLTRTLLVILIAVLSIPAIAGAYPFGGQAYIVRPCYNSAIFARLGGPRGGDFVWTPATRTYQFGRPRAIGQWLLGLASVPYECVVSLNKVDVWPADAIIMMGSSRTSGVNFGGGTPGAGVPALPQTTLGGSTGLADRNAGVQYILISEVFPAVDTGHGIDPDNEWVELHNPSATAVNLSGWKLMNTSSSITLPPNTSINPGEYLVIVFSGTTAEKWSISSTVSVSALGGGMNASGDRLVLTDSNTLVVDALSWGTDTARFTPPAGAPQVGQSLIRSSLARDTDLSTDWTVTSSPNPGR